MKSRRRRLPQAGGVAVAGGLAGSVANTDWSEYETVLGGANGQLLCLRGNGEVARHRYQLSDPQTGAGS